MIVDAMVLTRSAGASGGKEGNVLFVAGTRDGANPKDLLAPFEGRSGGLLMVVSPENGATLGRVELPSPPVFDGMAAAGGRLYVSTAGGDIICLGHDASRRADT
jgi:hypothetical protein